MDDEFSSLRIEDKWNESHIEKIMAWLTEKWGDGKACGQCGKPAWSIGSSPAALQLGSTDGKVTYGGSAYPCVAMICANCGNTVLLNAILAGIVTPPKKKEAGNVS